MPFNDVDSYQLVMCCSNFTQLCKKMKEYTIFKCKNMLHILNLNLLEWGFVCFHTNINKFSKNEVKGEFRNYIAFHLYR